MSETGGIEFDQVHLRLADGRELLRGISFSVEAGTTTALLGRSGSGKTTLLRTVNRLTQPTSGRVLLRGTDVSSGDVNALRRSIGYVIQETGLFPHWTVGRNVAAGLEVAGDRQALKGQRVGEMLKAVGLDESVAARRPHQLSGGQRQRVGLARAMATEPEVLLMDEPFGALDPLTRAEMQSMLRGLLRRLRKTTLIVTHDLREALFLADRVVLMEAGCVVADLPSAEVRTSEAAAVREYVQASDPVEAQP